ncbi:MAG: MBL fold metallo-hydrolase [Polyangiaceae bacterium]
MRLDFFGHSSWLFEAAGLRLLFDPLLFERHAGGVFSVMPARRIEPADLRADFCLVSHVHFDHFDVASLAALARHDPETVLVTSDPLVARASEIVGFHTVRLVEPGTRVELDEVTLTMTPSRAPDVEWGTIVEDSSGVAWNLIDTVFHSPFDVRTVRQTALGDRAIDLALVPIQPMREIALATADHVGFVTSDYGHFLGCAAATGAKTLSPCASGERFAEPYSAMNHLVYPVSRTRAARDLARYAPSQRVLVPAVGESLVLEGSDVSIAPGTIPLHVSGAFDPRPFRPLELAPMFDPNLDDRPLSEIREGCLRFCRDVLAPAIARELSSPVFAGLSLVLEIVLSDGAHLALTFDTKGNVTERGDDEYDVLVMVAGSMLLDVIEGRRGWVEPLLAGLLRSSVRGALVDPERVSPLPVAPMFPYYAISYRESIERATLARAEALARA